MEKSTESFTGENAAHVTTSRPRLLKTGIIILCLVFVSSISCACSVKQKKDSHLTILYTNDVHCSYENYPTIAAYKETLKGDGINTILVDGGDFVQGNPAGASDKGTTMIQLMNAVGYDYVVPGNHDYDYGMDAFIENASHANFEWITCNVSGTVTYENEFPYAPYKIIEVGKHHIALIGIEYEEKEDAYEKVRKAIADATDEGADFVIAVGHTGHDTKAIIENNAGIDIYLNAHDHVVNDAKEKILSYQDREGKNVPVYETGSGLQYMGKLILDCESEKILCSFELITVDELKSEVSDSMQKSAAKVRDACNTIVKKCDKIMQPYRVKIGESECTLCVYDPITFPRYLDYIEYNSTDFIADAFRAAGKTDIALLNFDSVRVGLFLGAVTKLDICNLFPWNSNVYTTNLNGQQIIEILEYNLRNYPAYTPVSPAVSGMTFTIDASVPWTENSNNRIKSVMIGDEPIDVDKMYSVTGSEYFLLVANKDIINKTVNDCSCIGRDYDVIETYIKRNLNGVIPKSIYSDPGGLHRINEITKAQDYCVLVNKTHPISEEFIKDMTMVGISSVYGDEVQLEKTTYQAYLELRDALADAGIEIGIDSGYRSVEKQQAIMDKFIEQYGKDYATKTVALPGTSEHNTGLAVDIVPKVNGEWIVENEDMLKQTEIFSVIHSMLPDYGFILRYPEGKEEITGYAYEPWHLRYVGKQAAQEIFNKNYTLEEYLNEDNNKLLK